jgi:hypothetical protein
MGREPAAGAGRRRVAKVVLVVALLLHGALLVRGGSDPHKLFGFRPFNESDAWQADILRVTADGDRRPIDDGTWLHDWDELVATNKLLRPGRPRHASAGADATLDFLQRALDWVVEVVDDPDTVALEATVVVHRNTRGPETVELRSRPGP